jgi:hypothetical protein
MSANNMSNVIYTATKTKSNFIASYTAALALFGLLLGGES